MAVAAGEAPNTLVLTWTPGAGATRHWIAGIPQSDLDAGDFSNLIWTAAQSNAEHTISGVDSGAAYLFAVAAGRTTADGGTEWSDWSSFARWTPGPGNKIRLPAPRRGNAEGFVSIVPVGVAPSLFALLIDVANDGSGPC